MVSLMKSPAQPFSSHPAGKQRYDHWHCHHHQRCSLGLHLGHHPHPLLRPYPQPQAQTPDLAQAPAQEGGGAAFGFRLAAEAEAEEAPPLGRLLVGGLGGASAALGVGLVTLLEALELPEAPAFSLPPVVDRLRLLGAIRYGENLTSRRRVRVGCLERAVG